MNRPMVTINGETMTVHEARLRYGISPSSVAWRMRVKGMSLVDAITTPRKLRQPTDPRSPSAAARRRTRRRTLREHRKALGLCLQCETPAIGSRCERHKAALSDSRQKRSTERKSQDICLDCEAPADGHRRCGDCLEARRIKMQIHREAKVEKGVCLDCRSMATDGRRHCDKCRARRSAWAAKGQKEAA